MTSTDQLAPTLTPATRRGAGRRPCPGPAASRSSQRSARAMALRAVPVASGLTEIDVMPCRTRNSANSGRLDRAWPHSDELMPAALAGGDDAGDGVEDGGVRLVERLGAHLGVPVDAQHELRQVVGPDRHPVDAPMRA